MPLIAGTPHILFEARIRRNPQLDCPPDVSEDECRLVFPSVVRQSQKSLALSKLNPESRLRPTSRAMPAIPASRGSRLPAESRQGSPLGRYSTLSRRKPS